MTFFVSQIQDLLLANAKGTFSTNLTKSGLSGYTYRRRRLLAESGVAGSNFTGISNPVMCLANGEVMFFSVTNDYYPVYDK